MGANSHSRSKIRSQNTAVSVQMYACIEQRCVMPCLQRADGIGMIFLILLIWQYILM